MPTPDVDAAARPAASGPSHFGARALALLGIDEAMAPVVVSRLWSLAAGPVTMLLVARCLSPDEQGFAYTFASLMALQMFLELGFSQSIIQFTAQAAAHLTLSPSHLLTGEAAGISRVSSLLRFFLRWYGALAAAFVLAVGPVGHWFLAHSGAHHTHWIAPWWILVASTALSIAVQPFWNVLTGLNQVAVTNRVGATNAVVLNVITWTVLLAGGALLANPLATLACVTGVQLRVLYRYRGLWRQLRQQPLTDDARIDFKADILPFQWRITFTFLTGYFVFELFTPACFRLAGPAAAGRFGMTLTLLLMVVNLCQAFVANRYPQFSMMFARGEMTALRASFRQAWLRCVLTAAAGLTLSVPLLAALRSFPVFSDRLLEWPLAATLAGAALIQCAALALVYYVRAQRKEPFVTVAWAQAVVTAAAIYYLGRALGLRGIVVAYLVSWCFGAPWIFVVFRTFWRRQAP